MSVFLIPLQPGTAQTLTIALDNITYTLTLRWNDVAQCWNLDISDANNNAILQNVPLVTGLDLLEQFAYLGIDGQLVVQTTNDADEVPTFASLGVTGNLYFVTTS